MNRRSMLTLITMAVAWLWIALPPSNAAAQPAGDMDGVKAASKAFYEKVDGRWLMVSHHVQPKPQ